MTTLALVAAGLLGLAIVSWAMGRQRAGRSPARVISTTDAQPAIVRACGGCTSGAELRARGEGKP